MPETILSVFAPLPPQRAFLKSESFIRGYGGAMGGGKSRCGCEAVFDAALDNPGLVVLVARQAHTSIVETTKKTMLNQVIPAQLITRSRASGGEDFIELWNGSRIHFVGLDDPLRWYSSEIGMAFFDEAQEIDEDTVLRIITRLRQRCEACEKSAVNTPCPHMPNRAILTFNPSNPGHWLRRWFIDGAEKTEFGFNKKELWMEGATAPLGTAEFFFAKATDNIHLPPGYVDQILGGMKEWMRRRYLDGIWEFTEGSCFFDIDALREYEMKAREAKILVTGTTAGDIPADVANRTRGGPKPDKDKIRIVKGDGHLWVWKMPVRAHFNEKTQKLVKAHRYVLSIDVSSGRGKDYSGIQVIDLDTFEQAAEWQGKLETGLVAEEAYRIGRVYNDALIVPEVTGAWGLAVDQVLKRYRYPRLYTRRVIDRLSQKYTDRTGFETQTRTRMMILENLETVIREREFGLYSLRTINELGTFVYMDNDRPEAQVGCNDDLCLALAIGLQVATTMPRQLRAPKFVERTPELVTGY